MSLKITRFLSLSLMGLGTGVSFSHLLQWKRKAELPADVFVRVLKTPAKGPGHKCTLLVPPMNG